jgi:hypothetical protein
MCRRPKAPARACQRAWHCPVASCSSQGKSRNPVRCEHRWVAETSHPPARLTLSPKPEAYCAGQHLLSRGPPRPAIARNSHARTRPRPADTSHAGRRRMAACTGWWSARSSTLHSGTGPAPPAGTDGARPLQGGAGQPRAAMMHARARGIDFMAEIRNCSSERADGLDGYLRAARVRDRHAKASGEQSL